jgi:hypothetical protein
LRSHGADRDQRITGLAGALDPEQHVHRISHTREVDRDEVQAVRENQQRQERAVFLSGIHHRGIAELAPEGGRRNGGLEVGRDLRDEAIENRVAILVLVLVVAQVVLTERGLADVVVVVEATPLLQIELRRCRHTDHHQGDCHGE